MPTAAATNSLAFSMFFRRALFILVASLHAQNGFTAPPVGHPGAEQAISLLGVTANEEVSANDLPNAGIVVSARDSNAFTFIEVKIDDTNDMARWIAAPRVKLTAGDRIRFAEGRLMKNFYSRKHDITFEAITFVSRVVQEGSAKP